MSKVKKQTEKKIKKKLTRKYRLVILNEDSFEERISFKINRLNILILGGVFSVLLISLTSIIIAYTPLKEYIPGYSSTALKQKATRLVYKSDSLEHVLSINNAYLESIRKVLSGKIDTFSAFNKDIALNIQQKNKDERK